MAATSRPGGPGGDVEVDVVAGQATNLGLADLTGRWLSTYRYHSTSRDAEFTSTHAVDLRLDGDRLVGRSEPQTDGSELTLALGVEGGVLRGTWTEHTSPEGHYRAAMFSGSLELVVDPTGRSMNGMWLGVSKQHTIKAGEWRLQRRVDAGTAPTAVGS